ncbi:MAG: TraR/DksA family transcriptional regulator [bacterium]
MMETEKKKEIITIIHAEIKKLEEKIAELKDFTDPVSPDNAIGRISRMDAINNKTIFDASMRNSQNRLKELKQILNIKDKEDFGKCIKCHQEIPFERLKIRPEIRRCAKCLNL